MTKQTRINEPVSQLLRKFGIAASDTQKQTREIINNYSQQHGLQGVRVISQRWGRVVVETPAETSRWFRYSITTLETLLAEAGLPHQIQHRTSLTPTPAQTAQTPTNHQQDGRAVNNG